MVPFLIIAALKTIITAVMYAIIRVVDVKVNYYVLGGLIITKYFTEY